MKPYYENFGITIYHGDCREVLPLVRSETVSACITDPPYGQTSLKWDRRVRGWLSLLPGQTLWCFGSMRFFMVEAEAFILADWKLAQDVVWQKHNGSNFHADRFRRVHESVAQFYKGPWSAVYKSPQRTADATKRTVRTKGRPPHMGHIVRTPYQTVDGGERLQRSVIEARSCHGKALHPTQKPIEIITPLIKYSCEPEGLLLDPFMGSGSVLVATRLLSQRAIGIEVQERYCEIAAKRLETTPLESQT